MLPNYVMLLIFFALIACFSSLSPDRFATLGNFRSLLSQNALLALAGLAVMVPLITDEFDLSVAAVVGLANVLAAGLPALHGFPVWLAILAVYGMALTVGVVHGLLIVWLDLDSLVITLGTSSVVTGFILLFTNGRVIATGVPESLTALGTTQFFGIQAPVYVLLAICVGLWFALTRRPWGRRMYASGAGRNAARLAGVATGRMRTHAFLLSAALSATAGILLAGRTSAGHPNIANDFLLPAFAAAFLGTAAFRVGFFNVWGTVLAIFVLAVGVNGLTIAGAPFWVDDIFNGTALVTAVALAQLNTDIFRRTLRDLRRRLRPGGRPEGGRPGSPPKRPP